MSEDLPRYSIYAEAASGQAEACFLWLSENMIQRTAVRITENYLGDILERRDIITKGFKDDAQREEYRTIFQSFETTKQRIFCIHYELQPEAMLKLRKELPSCFVNPVICESPFYPGIGAAIRDFYRDPDYCRKHRFYHFTGCMVCNSGVRGLLLLIWYLPQGLWYEMANWLTARFKSLRKKDR